jgi:hypothetical protein
MKDDNTNMKSQIIDTLELVSTVKETIRILVALSAQDEQDRKSLSLVGYKNKQ